jgi:predicted chitinase
MKLVTLVESPSSADIVKIYGSTHASDIGLLVTQCILNGITESNQISYVLATAKHETVDFASLYERYSGSSAYDYFMNKYGHRTDLGNRLGTDDGYDYRGRGFVQITGRDNYDRLGKIVGVDLLNNPDLAADPLIAAKIAAYGMKHGSFTGVGLDRFINDTETDYLNARKIVNGLDKADLIADYARTYDATLESTLPTTKVPYIWDMRTEPSTNDNIKGGGSSDELYGGKGNDQLLGGDGSDTYGFGKTDGKDVITDSDGQGQVVIDGKAVSGAAKYVNATTWTLDVYTLTKAGADVKIAFDANNDNHCIQLCDCASKNNLL